MPSQGVRRLDILVNNSGTNWAPPGRVSPGGWQKVMDTNLNGSSSSPNRRTAMIRQKAAGLSISLPSWESWVQKRKCRGIAYSASKGAVITFTKDLGRQVGEA